MGREAQYTEIRGVRYRVCPLGARVAQRVARRLIAVLAQLADHGGADAQGGLVSLSGDALARAAQAMGDEDLDFVVDALARETEIASEGGAWTQLTAVYDEHFRGSFQAQLGWLVFALRVSFPDFLRASAPSTATATGA